MPSLLALMGSGHDLLDQVTKGRLNLAHNKDLPIAQELLVIDLDNTRVIS